MTNFFNKPRPIDTNRNSALQVVQVWLWNRPYLSPQFVRALKVLVPELGEKKPATDTDDDVNYAHERWMENP